VAELVVTFARSGSARLRKAIARATRTRFVPVVGGIVVGVLLVTLVVLIVWTQAPAPIAFLQENLVVGSPTGSLNSSFFGVNVHVIGNGTISLPSESLGTPFVSFRFSPQGEATDQIHSITYNASGVGLPIYEEGDAAFISGCEAISCDATMMVPAEIDDPAEAAATVQYVEQNLSFHPQYWAIGNEPQQWTHWGIPWTEWRQSDHSTPSPMEYALEVQQYVTAIHAVDPAAKLIGIESVVAATTDAAWFRDLIAVNGPNLSAVAYHAYPGGNGTVPGTLENFFASLSNPLAFPLNYPPTYAIVREACPSCHLSVFVDEFNSALGGNFSALMTGYPEVPYVAAALAEAIQEHVQRTCFFDLEDLNGLMPYGLLTGGAPPRPAFSLFTGIIDHIVDGFVFNTTVPGGPAGISSVYTENATSSSLLVVNTNLTTGLTLTLPSGEAGMVGPGIPFYWNPSMSGPVGGPPVTNPVGMEWNLPPEGVLLIVWGP
jgi:hypothetical protein